MDKMTPSEFSDAKIGKLIRSDSAQSSFWLTMFQISPRLAVPLHIESELQARPLPVALAQAIFIRENAEALITRAEARIVDELRLNPSTFGLTPDEAGNYLPPYRNECLVEEPELTLHMDGSTLVRFAYGALPCCDPYGLAVIFHENGEVTVENLENCALDE
jgi:hypothetical protein